MDFSMVLEDNLAEELCKFREKSENCNIKIIEHIFHYYKPQILMNLEYMKRYYDDEATLSRILSTYSNICFDNSLEQLTKNTIYKIILSKDKNNFPYVNIIKDKIENNITASFSKNQERKKAKAHLKAMFEDAKSLFIYDKYLCSGNQNQKSFEEFANECFPKKILNIFYPNEEEIQFTQDLCSNLKQICNDWKIKENKNQIIKNECINLHDRYLIIDRKIQIIFTSGINYLMDCSKDFTYIVRVLNEKF